MRFFSRKDKIKPYGKYRAIYLGGYSAFPSNGIKGSLLIYSKPLYKIHFESKKVDFEIPFSSLKEVKLVTERMLKNRVAHTTLRKILADLSQGKKSKTETVDIFNNERKTGEYRDYDLLAAILEKRGKKYGWKQYLLIEFVDDKSYFYNEAALFDCYDKIVNAHMSIRDVRIGF